MTELDTYIFNAGANFSLPSFLVLNLNINIRMHKSLGSIFKITVKTFCSFSVPTKLVTVCEPFINLHVMYQFMLYFSTYLFSLPIQFTEMKTLSISTTCVLLLLGTIGRAEWNQCGHLTTTNYTLQLLDNNFIPKPKYDST